MAYTRAWQRERFYLLDVGLISIEGLSMFRKSAKKILEAQCCMFYQLAAHINPFKMNFLKRGIELRMSKENYEVIGKESHKVLLYKGRKGKSILVRELGPEFMPSGFSWMIRANAQAEQDWEAIVKSKAAYDTTIAKSFAHHKGSATEFSKYLKAYNLMISKKLATGLVRNTGKLGSNISDIGCKLISVKANYS